MFNYTSKSSCKLQFKTRSSIRWNVAVLSILYSKIRFFALQKRLYLNDVRQLNQHNSLIIMTTWKFTFIRNKSKSNQLSRNNFPQFNSECAKLRQFLLPHSIKATWNWNLKSDFAMNVLTDKSYVRMLSACLPFHFSNQQLAFIRIFSHNSHSTEINFAFVIPQKVPSRNADNEIFH